jgi:hypothetical protein
MRHRITLRIYALVGVVAVALVGVVLLMASLRRGPGRPAPTPLAEIERPASATDELVAATVNGTEVVYSTWAETFAIDQVMSGIAGQPAPTAEETLQRLINEQLLLQSMPSLPAPGSDDVDAYIVALQSTWQVDNAALSTALERVDLDRAALERSITRLLLVEAGLHALHDRGEDPDQWLQAQRASARIIVMDDLATPSISVALLPSAAPLATPTTVPTLAPIQPTPTAKLGSVRRGFLAISPHRGMVSRASSLRPTCSSVAEKECQR